MLSTASKASNAYRHEALKHEAGKRSRLQRREKEVKTTGYKRCAAKHMIGKEK
jgi:hypothetical protein